MGDRIGASRDRVVHSAKDLALEQLKNQIYPGSLRYIKDIRHKIDSGKNLSEVPKSRRRPQPELFNY